MPHETPRETHKDFCSLNLENFLNKQIFSFATKSFLNNVCFGFNLYYLVSLYKNAKARI